MIDAGSVRDLIETYRKHGWVLRRVLLTPASSKVITARIFDGVQIDNSHIDAAWFSRPPTTGLVSWELRYLGDTPYALLQKVDEKSPEFDAILKSVEARFTEAIAAKREA
jgi:hypothetical protein